MFYDKFVELCNENGLSPNKAALLIGFDRTLTSKWKSTGYTPRQEILVKIAEYFGVTTDYLLGNSDEKNKPLVNNDEELTDYLEELKNRKEMRMLFSVSKGCTKEEVEQAVRIIEALRKNGDD